MTSDGKGSMMTAYVMSALIAIVVAIALVAASKKAFVEAFINYDKNPEYQAKMISIALSRMIYMPEGTKFYYELPQGDCVINITSTLVRISAGGKNYSSPIDFTRCNITTPFNGECAEDDTKELVFEKCNGNVNIYEYGHRSPCLPRLCR